MAVAKPNNSGCDLSNFSAPRGFALRRLNADRRSFGKDSGRMKNPYSAFVRLSAAAAQNGYRRPIPPSIPPSAGPTINPNPNAAPNIPNFAARFSGGVTSAIYAFAVGKLAAVIPEITRPTNNQLNVGATAINR